MPDLVVVTRIFIVTEAGIVSIVEAHIIWKDHDA